MTVFVDTNVFIRFLSGDDPEKTRRCLELFERAENGEAQLTTSESVIAEIVYVLSSRALYNLPRNEVARLLRPIIGSRGLTLEHKHSFLYAMDLYQDSKLDFEDCLTVAHARRGQLGGLYSYDRGFDGVPSLKRIEP